MMKKAFAVSALLLTLVCSGCSTESAHSHVFDLFGEDHYTDGGGKDGYMQKARSMNGLD